MPQIPVRTGSTLNYELSGDGEPLLLVMGTSGAIPLWGEMTSRLAQTHQVIAFDNRGLGGSDRGTGPISVVSLAEDASALLEAIEVPRAHVLGWSLGSAVAQELALTHPEQDLLTPLWQSKKVADAIPGAQYELVTGPGSSHGLHIERPEDLTKIVAGFLGEHAIDR